MFLIILEDGRENADGILVHVLFDPLAQRLVQGAQLLVVLLVLVLVLNRCRCCCVCFGGRAIVLFGVLRQERKD